MKQLRAQILGVLAATMLAGPAYATDVLIEGARQCTQYFPVKERQYGIPVHLLAAISSIETGRYHKGLGMALPWPWTINVEGKGYFFNSKAEAIAETERHLKMGQKSIDVGCMQVNLMHHPDAFSNLDDAFDPEKNVDYAARFLKDNYKDLGNSWVKAAAAYHSRTPSLGNGYLRQVAKAWQTIVAKVQEAQARMGASGAVASAAPVEAAAAPAQVAPAQGFRVVNGGNADTREVASTFGAQVAAAPAPAKTMHPISSVHNTKVISVSKKAEARRASVVVVSEPKPVSAEIAASYSPQAGSPQSAPVSMASEAPVPHAVTPRRVSVDEADVSGRGPHFVFSN